MNPNSLRLVLVSVVVMLQLISLTVVGFLTTEQLDNQAQQEATASLKAQANDVVEKTRLFLVPALSQLTSTGQLFVDGMLDARRDQQLATFFRSQLRANLWLKGMYLAREDGSMVRVGRFGEDRRSDPGRDRDLMVTKIIRVSGDDRHVRLEELNETTGETRHWQNPADAMDPRQLHWYQDARSKQGLVWSNVFSYYFNGQPVVSASLPVKTPEGMDAGVLSVAVDLRDLTDFIDMPNGESINAAVMIDANGRVIAHSAAGQDVTYDSMTDMETTVRPFDQALMELYARTREQGAYATDKDTLIEQLNTGEKQQMGMATSVKLFHNAINWTLLITQPHWTRLESSDELLSSVMRLATIIIAAPGIMALLLILAITAPIYRLYRRATVDQLTRAFNRDEFQNRLGNQIAEWQSSNHDQQLLCAVLDLDGFKSINDNHGHPVGDLILRAVVKRLQKSVPEGTVIGRLGGDEFALVCQLDSDCDPIALLETLRREVTARPVPSNSGVHAFGMTIGLAMIRAGDTVDAVLQRADLALVKGKLVEKNRTYDATAAEPGNHESMADRTAESTLESDPDTKHCAAA